MSNDIGRSLFRVQVKIRKDKSDDYFRDVFLLQINMHSNIESYKLKTHTVDMFWFEIGVILEDMTC